MMSSNLFKCFGPIFLLEFNENNSCLTASVKELIKSFGRKINEGFNKYV